MKLTIEINTEGVTFEENQEAAFRFILGKLQERIYHGDIRPDDNGWLHDSNGNRVGHWEWK